MGRLASYRKCSEQLVRFFSHSGSVHGWGRFFIRFMVVP